jgi:SAM-dependent methyltransferase
MTGEIENYKEVRDYFEQWHVYQVIIENDYMEHCGIHNSLSKSLRSTFKESFSILDLGCGDGSRIAKTLDKLTVSLYIGVDLSVIALRKAKKNFAGQSIQLKLVQGEFGEYLKDGETPEVDVILAGFALHHYEDEKKAQFFQDCINKLNTGGSLYLYDLFCRSGETRKEYIHSYCDILERSWSALSPEERNISCDHIRNFDYPVSFHTLAGYAEEAGFACPSEPLYADENRFHCLYHFTR